MPALAPSQSQTSLTLPETDLNTIPDPRSPSPHAVSRQSSTNSMRHPDLSNEVATLSTKLINAINHQTNLDDQLQTTRHELEAARERIVQLETAAQEHKSLIERGLLVQRSDSERIQNGLRSKIDVEHKARSEAEKEKKAMEQELETLTSALFEEANGMVATARQEKEASDRQGDQLRAKLDETQALLASHQEQLRDLKAVMQQLQAGGNDSVPAASAPPTPVLASAEKAPRAMELLEQARAGTPTQVSFPEAPLSYTTLLQPVVRTDLSSYEDFLSLLRTTQHASSRATSGTFSGLNVLGLGARDSAQSTVSLPQGPSNSSDPSISPNVPGAFNGPSPVLEPSSPTSSTNLKDTKFYKRTLAEDIEPTLRLDAAPGLSWLARRSVLNAMLTGNLIIEPLPPSSRQYSALFSCSMCGEMRKEYDYVRRHRFKTSDSEDVQTYPLCDYCLARVRATCDFMGFMRLAKKGHYRNESYAECKFAWEESVRLRERMFWSRVGGGVVPANTGMTTMPQSPTFGEMDDGRPSRNDDAIRTGRTLGGFRKRLSEATNASSNGSGTVTQARQTSLPVNTPPTGSRLNPSRASMSASPRAASPIANNTDERSSATVAQDEVATGEAPQSLNREESTETQAEASAQLYSDMANSPAQTPDLAPTMVTDNESSEAVSLPVDGASAPAESPSLKPALPGPTGSLRQFPRSRPPPATLSNSPPKPKAESPAATSIPSTSVPSPTPKLSKVASMAAKFQQDSASAGSPPPGDRTVRPAGLSPSRAGASSRSQSRPSQADKDKEDGPEPKPIAQIAGAFG